jgi:S1-C subfamily serine protease
MRILSLLLTLAALLSLGTDARGDDGIPPDVLKAIKKATAFVKVEVEGNKFSGSGFVVKVNDGTAYVVTNHHVIEPKLVQIVAEWRSAPSSRRPIGPRGPHGRIGPRTYVPSNPTPSTAILTPRLVARTLKDAKVTVVFQSGTPQEQSLKAEVLAADPDVDLAILKAAGVKQLAAPIDCNQDFELSETMPVYVFGFPFGEVMQIVANGKGNPAITIGRASISSLRHDDAGELALVQIDGAMNHGNSGGPIVDSHGRLVGVSVATIKDSNGIGLAIPCKKVPQLMAGHLGKPHLQVARNANGVPTIQVEASLIDPFHKIKSAGLRYLSADKVKEKPAAADSLQALPGSHHVALKIEDQLAQGQFPVRKGLDHVHILYQGVYTDAAGRQQCTASVEQTLDLTTSDVASKIAPQPADWSKPGPHSTAKNAGAPPKSAQEFAAVVGDLNSGDFSRRVRAMQQLRGHPRQPNVLVARALEHVLANDSNAPLRISAAQALENWGTRESLSALEEAADKDPDPTVRANAASAIAAIKRRQPASSAQAENAGPRLAPSPLPPMPPVTAAPRHVAPPVASDLNKAPESPEELAAVVSDLDSGDFGRRVGATLRLLRGKPREPNPAVAAALVRVLQEDGNAAIRANAVRGLENWGTAESIPALEEAAQKDSFAGVRNQAPRTIEAIKRRL